MDEVHGLINVVTLALFETGHYSLAMLETCFTC